MKQKINNLKQQKFMNLKRLALDWVTTHAWLLFSFFSSKGSKIFVLGSLYYIRMLSLLIQLVEIGSFGCYVWCISLHGSDFNWWNSNVQPFLFIFQTCKTSSTSIICSKGKPWIRYTGSSISASSHSADFSIVRI